MKSLEGKNVFVTGGAGFIGSNLVEALVEKGAHVTVYDNLSSGKIEFIDKFRKRKDFAFVKADLLDVEKLNAAMHGKGIDLVMHLAANPDISLGTKVTDLDFKQGAVATYNVLEAARKSDVKEFAFSSSSAVYGIATVKPTPENYGPLAPISLYGASKLASEGYVTAFSHLFGISYCIYRFANVVGKNSTHGVIFDFVRKLSANPKELLVLGDGNQRKAYIEVGDCADAMLSIYERSNERENLFNLTTRDQMQVSDIANEVVNRFAKNAKIKYTGTKQGWPGDVPDTFLDGKKMESMGVKLKFKTSRDAVMNLIDIVAKTRK